MDTPTGTPSTPAYSRDSSVAAVVVVAAATNPSTGSFGFATAAAPPSTGVACGPFMPPRMTSAAGGLAPAPAMNPRAPSCSSQMWRGRRRASVNDEAYMSTMGVGSNNSHRSQTNDMKDAKEKKKRKGDDELKNAMEAIVKARKEVKEVKKMARTQDVATEERRLVAEESRVAAEERNVTLEERKVAMEERSRLLEWEKYLFFLDTYTLSEAQTEYINLTREEVLIQKRATLRCIGGGGIGGMDGFRAPPVGIGGMGGGGMGGMGGMDGFGAPPGGIGGMGGGGIGGMGGMDGFGAPPGGIGGMGGMSFASEHLRMILPTPVKRRTKNPLRMMNRRKMKMKMKMKTRTRIDVGMYLN
ncbi:hypothetical protein D1007_02411 [Hordeum vulgare]|nr:hypothetical protein D1007_02411 [Hordeum vulgare]